MPSDPYAKRVYRLRIELSHCSNRCPSYTIQRSTPRFSKPREVFYCSSTGNEISGDSFANPNGTGMRNFPEFCPLDTNVDE